ncbi:hypothetical protein FN846DRAFT_205956 [Sphaerosporella brunnea]|uniref:Uncharacterized protein n=1 Tax=Sphaerosporella brunnea TaxID=1250544 RepID=A0A5J5EN45_9PEZI|nr:hypothetical protein FN846DRAFT_205956 [Sphaerosporella brunnea]
MEHHVRLLWACYCPGAARGDVLSGFPGVLSPFVFFSLCLDESARLPVCLSVRLSVWTSAAVEPACSTLAVSHCPLHVLIALPLHIPFLHHRSPRKSLEKNKKKKNGPSSASLLLLLPLPSHDPAYFLSIQAEKKNKKKIPRSPFEQIASTPATPLPQSTTFPLKRLIQPFSQLHPHHTHHYYQSYILPTPTLHLPQLRLLHLSPSRQSPVASKVVAAAATPSGSPRRTKRKAPKPQRFSTSLSVRRAATNRRQDLPTPLPQSIQPPPYTHQRGRARA